MTVLGPLVGNRLDPSYDLKLGTDGTARTGTFLALCHDVGTVTTPWLAEPVVADFAA
jgi:hypothetical protein